VTCYQGNDLEVGTNCLGPYLLSLLLEPILAATSTLPNTPAGSVRIVWEVAVLQGQLHKNGMQFEADGTPKVLTKFMANYMQSKVGVAWLTGLFADRLGGKGVLSVCVHPGLMPTPLQRHQPWFLNNVVRPLMVYFVPGFGNEVWLLIQCTDAHLQTSDQWRVHCALRRVF